MGKTAHENFDEGYKLFQKEEFALAIRYFDLALRQHQNSELSNPDHKNSEIKKGPKSELGKCLRLKGMSLYYLCQYDEAFPVLENALQYDKEDAELWYEIGMIHYLRKEYADAVCYYNEALRCRPCFPQVLNGKGLIYNELEEYGKAIAYYKKALALQSDLGDAWLNLGNTFSTLEEHEKAFHCYRKASKYNPENPLYQQDVLSYAGDELNELGQSAKALPWFDQALKINPQSFQIWFNKGEALEKLGEDKKALFCYTQAQSLLNAEPEPVVIEKLQIAIREYFMLISLEQYETAILGCCKMRGLANFNSSWSYQGYAHLLRKKFTEAEECFNQILPNLNGVSSAASSVQGIVGKSTEIPPSQPQPPNDAIIFALQGLEFIEKRQNKHFSFQQTERYISEYPQEKHILSQLYLLRGHVLFAFGQDKKARSTLQQILKTDPQYTQSQQLIKKINEASLSREKEKSPTEVQEYQQWEEKQRRLLAGKKDTVKIKNPKPKFHRRIEIMVPQTVEETGDPYKNIRQQWTEPKRPLSPDSWLRTIAKALPMPLYTYTTEPTRRYTELPPYSWLEAIPPKPTTRYAERKKQERTAKHNIAGIPQIPLSSFWRNPFREMRMPPPSTKTIKENKATLDI